MQMDVKRLNELTEFSLELYETCTRKMMDYIGKKYLPIMGDTTQNQLEDYVFMAEETSAYILGNAFALLGPDAQEKAIESFVNELRRMINVSQKKLDKKPPVS